MAFVSNLGDVQAVVCSQCGCSPRSRTTMRMWFGNAESANMLLHCCSMLQQCMAMNPMAPAQSTPVPNYTQPGHADAGKTVANCGAAHPVQRSGQIWIAWPQGPPNMWSSGFKAATHATLNTTRM